MFNRNGSNNGPSDGTGDGIVHINGNGRQPDAAPASSTGQAIVGEHDLLWDGLSPTVTEQLNNPLDPALVSQRKGRANRDYVYVEGRTAIDQANRIFGFGGWGYEVVGEVTQWQNEHADPQTGEVKRVRSYAATVKVTVPGAPSRTDVGFHTVAEENGEGHETAYKGCVTDGLKRALRSFGAQFGNALHGDGETDAVASVSEQALAPSLRKALVGLGASQGLGEQQVREAVRSRTGKDFEELRASELARMVEGAAVKLQQARTVEAAPQPAAPAPAASRQAAGDTEMKAAA